jgi:hypothetical protein
MYGALISEIEKHLVTYDKAYVRQLARVAYGAIAYVAGRVERGTFEKIVRETDPERLDGEGSLAPLAGMTATNLARFMNPGNEDLLNVRTRVAYVELWGYHHVMAVPSPYGLRNRGVMAIVGSSRSGELEFKLYEGCPEGEMELFLGPEEMDLPLAGEDKED